MKEDKHISDITTGLSLKDAWISDMEYKLQLAYPNESKEKIHEYVKDEYKKHFKDHKAILYDNYNKVETEITLKAAFDWIQENHPLLSESGTLFRQHADCYNPDAEILQMNLNMRKQSKKKMFQYKDELSEARKKNASKKEIAKLKTLVEFYNRDQKRRKVIVNSYYGGSGLPSSRFYNLACATSTTGRGQALISTARAVQEDFLADNVGFISMDECIRFIILTCEEKDSRKQKDDKWIEDKSLDDVIVRLDKKFINKDDADNAVIKKFLANLSQEDLNRIYYKSNLEEFFLNSKKARHIIDKIASSNESYMDPNSPPEEFKEDLYELRDALLEYVHFCHPIIDRVYRLKFHKRKRVITID